MTPQESLVRPSENFSLKEFFVSAKYPNEARAMVVTVSVVANLARLTNVLLQPLRDFLGHGIAINRGYADAALNAKQGGKAISQHQYGEAADCNIQGQEAWDAYFWLMENARGEIGQCIIYLTTNRIAHFVHISVRSLRPEYTKRGEFLVKLDDKPDYYVYDKGVPGVTLPKPKKTLFPKSVPIPPPVPGIWPTPEEQAASRDKETSKVSEDKTA